LRSETPLRFVTFLAPHLFDFYAFVAHRVASRVGCRSEITVGTSYDELPQADVAFVCGLPYVETTLGGASPVEPVAAPVLRGRRYGGRPIYFSDVIVRRGSGLRSFDQLRGSTWAYNEPHSQSGYGITRDYLVNQGETGGFFGKVIEAGWHERAADMVRTGEADAAAIDSHVLETMTDARPRLRRELAVIHTLGPSTIQPVVAARRLPAEVRRDVRAALVALADDPAAARPFAAARVERFVPVRDADYDDIRAMHRAAAAADFLTLR
jgi:phosphonate transport system substrate-binding protein